MKIVTKLNHLTFSCKTQIYIFLSENDTSHFDSIHFMCPYHLQIDEKGWHQVFVSEFLAFGEAENYKTEMENELKKDGSYFDSLKTICRFRQSTRNTMVEMWMNLMVKINALRIATFIEAKPQYKPVMDSMAKKLMCFSATNWSELKCWSFNSNKMSCLKFIS